MTMIELIVYGILAHLFADFFLQNLWMNDNKMWLSRSYAGWVHGFIHFLVMLLVFPYHWAICIAVLHIVIDTRVPLQLWRKFYRQSQSATGYGFVAFAMWQDQVAHFLVIALMARLATLS